MVHAEGVALALDVARPGSPPKRYRLPRRDHDAWLDLHAAIAADFGARAPLNRRPAALPPPAARLEPVLTEAVSPDILYGFGDPCVLHVPEEGAWYLVATSNDAPQSFPILKSSDLKRWELASFAFPQGGKPGWCLEGLGRADFWAPEIHRVGGGYWLVFSARQADGELAIGLATSARPEGPYRAQAAPLLTGGVIDPHLHVAPDGTPLLFWKVDDNGVWPRRLAALLGERPELAGELFDNPEDRRTAALAAALWPWLEANAPPMEQFFALQPLIEAAAEDLAGFEARLSGEAGLEIAETLRTRVYAQALSPDGAALVGARHLVLQNDQPWEAHLIEGVWVSEAQGRWFLFYAGNDFSTPQYGIGAAVADGPLGPYRKLAAPLLGSSTEWVGPGHPSVAPGPDGRPRLFLHAFFPGRLGYKAFRAVLSADLTFEGDAVRLG
ncbi:family 43 glycosylhydrolase [Phenylobacterium terrae]|uniref:Family 43 glycosylhydrolase n=2 Tax=Phenylobacterium terrae TaxID=2665495 RepID=A0ABW4N1D3_9CAUL